MTVRGMLPICVAFAVGIGVRHTNANVVTSLFQKGVSPDGVYTQCFDSTLRSLAGYTFGMQSLGRASTMNPRWADSEGAMLLQFDLSRIPSHAGVSSATLRIWFEPDEFEDTSGYLAAYRLNDPSATGMWQENTNAVSDDYGPADAGNAYGCAAYKRPNVPWTDGGGRVTDVTGPVARAWHVAGTTEWIEIDVTDDARLFVQSPSSNLGWLVYADTDGTLRGSLYTSDATNFAVRPQLRVLHGEPGPRPPVADAGPDQLLTDGDTNGWEWATLDGSGSSDPDGTIVSWLWSTGGVQVATGEVAMVAIPIGTNLVSLRVVDDNALEDEDTLNIVVRVPSTNEPPVLDPIGNRLAWIGVELSFFVSASDPDEDSLTFSATNLPIGAIFADERFSWTPTPAQTGMFLGVEFRVEDGRGGVDWEAIDILVQAPSAGVVWYIRPDGGSCEQCTGLADAPYPGTGTNQPCAWDHPFRALPPGETPRIAGGDTLIVGAGSYRMGYGAPGAEACSSAWPWDCHMPPIPSGPNATQPTRILGAGWDSGCANKPELWGAERAPFILNLTGVTNVEIRCLELTDHHGCVEFHSGGIPCPRDTFPYGDWCSRGIHAQDARSVYLYDLDIHGLASAGVRAGRLADWTVENVRIAGNGWVGWDGDIDGDDANTGSLTFRGVIIEWNGCGETWPGGQPTGCWAQTAGGYGDGLGTGHTGGDWVFEDCAFLYNTSDGLDLLYVREPGSSIVIRRTHAEGNAGNQLKTSGPAHIENCVVVGNCAFFEGKPFTYNVDPCRAMGNTLSLTLGTGDWVSVVNSTITGEGDCLVLVACMNESCDGTESVVLRNNVFLGHTDFHQPFENTCLTYSEGFPADPFDMDFSIVTDVKNDPCPVGPNDLCGNPQLADMTLAAFDARLLSNSPAIDAGTNLATVGCDYAGVSRPLDGNHDGVNRHDIGAYEYVHPLADSDGDFMGDADEVVAGTDPTNRASFFALSSFAVQPDAVLRWQGVSERRYDLFFAPAVSGSWEAVEGATNLPGADATMAFTNDLADGRRFFRLRVLKP